MLEAAVERRGRICSDPSLLDAGKGFDALNAGSQKYFGTLNKA